ncbi:MAG: sugar phosphate isomerase/epimerase [Acidobacteria bacterium]|nr:sugar phosphate isomerase/epimerase [Acidobacteriota bacterium]
MMELGFHTDAFTSAFWSFEQCLAWAQANDVHWIECGVIDGVSWLHGLGYHPHIALWEDPVLLRTKMDRYGVAFSQLDAAFPLSTPEGPTIGLEYVLHTIQWAKLAGCPRIDTTDDHDRPQGMTDREAMDQMRRIYTRILKVAEAYQITINIEPHGYYTTKPDFLAEMLSFVDSPYLRLNMDIGNVFIAGQNPVEFVELFHDKISHVHVKDISERLAAESRGELTGIAGSHCAIGDGMNAGNVRQCVAMLAGYGYRGVLTIECEAQGGLIEGSLAWMRKLIGEIQRPDSGRGAVEVL